MPGRLASGVVVSLAALAGCSSSSGSGGGGQDQGARSATFAAYCTGTLTHAAPLMAEQPGEAWVGDGTLQAPSGTPFLLSDEFQQWQGYVIEDDGTPAEIDALNGLVEGKDFTSTCAPSTIPDQFTAAFVLLADTKLYTDESLSGTPCVLPAGTALTQYSVVGGSPVTVSSAEVTAKCGASTMYAQDFAAGQLLPQ